MKAVKNYFLVCALLFGAITAYAQEGPGGVGNSTNNRYWYDAADLSATNSDGDQVSSWPNKGGNGSAATQSGTDEPMFRSAVSYTMNGFPVIEFDGVNDLLVIPNSADLNTGAAQSERTFHMVIRTGMDVATRQMIFEEGGATRGLNIYLFNGDLYFGAWNFANDGAGSPWGFSFVSTPIADGIEYIITMVKQGNNSSSGTIECYVNGQSVGTMNGIGLLYAHSGAIGLGGKNGGSFYETGNPGSGSIDGFSGDVAEFIHYSNAVNFAERTLIENYLSSKYAIALGANDVYSMDTPGNGNYDNEVAGIGQASDGTNNIAGQGPSIVEMNSANDLANSEFLVWGHDNGALTETTTGIPVSVDRRLNRVWRVSEAGDVGTTTIEIDVNSASVSGAVAADFSLLIDNADTDFSDALVVPAASVTSGIVSFTGINLVDGDFFTLGTQISPVGNVGPAGVGDNSQYRYWYDANDLVASLNDSDPVSSWANKGGNGTAANQSGTAQPLFRNDGANAMNGYPVLTFDGSNDYLVIPNDNDLNLGNAQDERTFMLAFRTGSNVTSRQVLFEEGGGVRGLNIYIVGGDLYLGGWNINSDGTGAPWAFNFINTSISANTEYVVTMVKAGNSSITGTISGYLNGQSFGAIPNIGFLYAHSGAIGIGAMNNDTYFETGSASGNGNYFGGAIAEFVHYNYAVSTAERIIVENYLTARYGIAMGSNDFYTMDNGSNGDYDHDVAGIGQATDGSSHDDGKGEGRVRAYLPSGLANNEFFLWGHNNEPFCNSTDVPGSLVNRPLRVWRASEIGDIGSHRISFDLTGITYGNVNDLKLLVDGDGVFSNATIYNLSNSSGDIVEFYGVNIAAGDYFTLASTNLFVDNSGSTQTTWLGVNTNWFSGSNWDNGVPTALQNALIPASLINYPVINSAGAVCQDLTIQAGGSVEVSGSNTLTVSGNWDNSGTFIENESTVLLQGACGSASISNNGPQSFYNLTLDNAEGAAIGNRNVNIISTLTLTSGTLLTNDSLTLLSDAAGTARIAEITGGAISGEIMALRYIDGGSTNWRFLTFPVSGADLEQFDDDFITSGFPGTDHPLWPAPENLWPSFYFYDEALGTTYNDGFTPPGSTSDIVSPGEGLWIYCGDSLQATAAFTVDVRGPANTGDIAMPVSYTSTGSSANDGWSLVANPYPCPIDWDDASWTKTNVNNATHIWNPQNSQYASYVGGVGTNGGSRYISSFQAFFVQTSAASPTLTVRESCKVDQEQTFIRRATKETFRLALEGAGESDEIAILFDPQATDGFDAAADALLFSPFEMSAARLSSVAGENDYSINTMATFDGYKVIPIRVTAPEGGQFTIRATDLTAVSEDRVLIEDTYTGTMLELSAETNYEFYQPAGMTKARFLIHINPDETADSEATIEEDQGANIAIYPNPVKDQLWVQSNDLGTDLTIQFFDLSGRLLLSQNMASGTAQSVDVSNLSTGMYLYRLEANGQLLSTDRVMVSR